LYHLTVGFGIPVTSHMKCTWLLSRDALGAVVRVTVGAAITKIH